MLEDWWMMTKPERIINKNWARNLQKSIQVATGLLLPKQKSRSKRNTQYRKFRVQPEVFSRIKEISKQQKELILNIENTNDEKKRVILKSKRNQLLKRIREHVREKRKKIWML